MRSLFAYTFVLFACTSMTFANKPLRGTTSASSQQGLRAPAAKQCVDENGRTVATTQEGQCPSGSEALQVKLMCLSAAGGWSYPLSSGKCKNGVDPVQVNFQNNKEPANGPLTDI